MAARARRHRLVDLATAAMALAAVAVAAGSRMPAAWRGSDTLEVGDRAPAGLRVRTLPAGDTLAVAGGMPTLLLFYTSDCPACARAVSPWRRLLARSGPGVRPLAVGLEEEGPALAWLRSELPRALAVRPLQPAGFLERLGVERVPTTLLVGRGGRLLHRRVGVPTPAVVDRLLVLAGARAPPARPGPVPPPLSRGRDGD